MKLTLTIAVAIVGLLYAIVKQFDPTFPITPDQLLQILIVVLGWLGITVVEGVARTVLIKRGFKNFLPK